MKMIFIFLFFIFSFLNLTQAGVGGGMDSSGGDSCSLEFKDIAQNIHLDLLRKNLKLSVEISHKKFWEKFLETKVKCVDEAVICEGEEKDACNTPSLRLIEVNRFRWDAISLGARKYQLVFHEYLGIMQIDDVDGKLSNIYLKKQQVQQDDYVVANSSPVNSAIVAEAGSLLANYDKDAKVLEALFQNSDIEGIKKMSLHILKKYFGFTTVVLENNSERELLAIYNMAKNLRYILPANFRSLSYIGIRREIDSKVIKEKIVIDGNSEVDHRLIVNEKSSEIAFSQRMEGLFTKQPVCELRLMGVAGISAVWNMKGLVVQMINCFQPYYKPEYDIPRE